MRTKIFSFLMLGGLLLTIWPSTIAQPRTTTAGQPRTTTALPERSTTAPPSRGGNEVNNDPVRATNTQVTRGSTTEVIRSSTTADRDDVTSRTTTVEGARVTVSTSTRTRGSGDFAPTRTSTDVVTRGSTTSPLRGTVARDEETRADLGGADETRPDVTTRSTTAQQTRQAAATFSGRPDFEDEEATRANDEPTRASTTSQVRTTTTFTRPLETREKTDPPETREATDPLVRYDATTRLDDGIPCSDTCSGTISLLRDGRCQEANNNCGCDWDDGDCCEVSGDEAQFLYCTLVADGTCCRNPAVEIIPKSTELPVPYNEAMKYSDYNANSCTSKYSCMGSSCDKVISKTLAKSGILYTYEKLESYYGCDCSNCGSTNPDDLIVAIAGMD